MSPRTDLTNAAPVRHHKRTPSSMLKSLVGPRSHKRAVSKNASSGPADENVLIHDPHLSGPASSFLPLDHPHSNKAPLGQLATDNETSSSPAVHQVDRVGGSSAAPKLKTPRKKTLIEITGNSQTPLSSKSPVEEHQSTSPNPKGKGKVYQMESPSSTSSPSAQESKQQEKDLKKKSRFRAAANKTKKPKQPKHPKQPKQPTSSSSLRNLFSKSRSTSNDKDASRADPKVDPAPKNPLDLPWAVAADHAPPIWAQYTSHPTTQYASRPEDDLFTYSGPVSPNTDFQSTEDEISRYTPVEYSPSKQRNFEGEHQPSLISRNVSGERPRSSYLPSRSSFRDALSGAKDVRSDIQRDSSKKSAAKVQSSTTPHELARSSSQPRTRLTESQAGPATTAVPDKEAAKHASRVKTAAAFFNGIARRGSREQIQDQNEVDATFEALLDSRNIPENMRQRLRDLDANIKADLIRQDKVESAAATARQVHPTSEDCNVTARPMTGSSHTAEVSPMSSPHPNDVPSFGQSKKHKKTRSKAFSFSKSGKDAGILSLKKKGSNSSIGNSIKKTFCRSRNGSMASLTSSICLDGTSDTVVTKSSLTTPDEFVAYLKHPQPPQQIEVGKIHRLRLVLRNERVSWVECFIHLNGMTHLVAMLRSVMSLEWREDHEDQLLHELLSCLKALCTTSLALKELQGVEATLFPALLAMLFDKERKGPSEFTTRGLIMSTIYQCLCGGPSETLAQRARTILSYLRDPTPPDHEQPHAFILAMRKPRPYKAWCGELWNVTGEVFWIYLHERNVVSLREPPPECGPTYRDRHFPRERLPVPAAPYVGGVEWDTANYLATHLDLMNALLASLPSREERNALREDLRMSRAEETLGRYWRTCREKFYGCLHDGLRVWVAAASEDGWDVSDVRFGPRHEEPYPKSRAATQTPGAGAGATAAGEVASAASGRARPGEEEKMAPQIDLPIWAASGSEEEATF
ncbi:MAG: hypothetical protein M1825_006232 [Sarcosagium campestre]|nr:MAG: hypothetical protein M1825_006232 [Sarcosagium campestre]